MIDGYGFDKDFHDKAMKFWDFMANYYWRVEIEGLENIPENGRGMLVMNHAGTIALDVLIIKQIVFRNTINERIAWTLMADFLTWTPFVGDYYWRTGNVLACWKNAARLLDEDKLIIVCPEGTKGVGKLFKERYQVKSFGKGGFARLAIQKNAPIIPISVVGAEETYPIVYKNEKLGEFLGFPFLPITFTFPLLGLLGAFPLPSKWHVKFDKPVDPENYVRNYSQIEKKAKDQQIKFVEDLYLYPCGDRRREVESNEAEENIARDVTSVIKRNLKTLLNKRKNIFF